MSGSGKGSHHATAPNGDPIIRLTEQQVLMADQVAYAIQQGMRPNARDSAGIPERPPEVNLHVGEIGQRGELAAGIWLGLENEYPVPQGGDDYGNPDYWPDIEIRTTTYRSGKLILRDEDVTRKGSRRYILVRADSPTEYTLRGWCVAGDYRDTEAYTDGAGEKPARWIRARDLKRMNEWDWKNA